MRCLSARTRTRTRAPRAARPRAEGCAHAGPRATGLGSKRARAWESSVKTSLTMPSLCGATSGRYGPRGSSGVDLSQRPEPPESKSGAPALGCVGPAHRVRSNVRRGALAGEGWSGAADAAAEAQSHGLRSGVAVRGERAPCHEEVATRLELLRVDLELEAALGVGARNGRPLLAVDPEDHLLDLLAANRRVERPRDAAGAAG